LVGASVAYDASREGLERFEDKAGKAIDKVREIKNRKQEDTQPPTAA
jgi:hypothetical protein